MTKLRIWQGRMLPVILSLILGLLSTHILWAGEDELFQRGNDLLQDQNYDEALAAYEAFVQGNPGHRLLGAARWTMGNIHMMVREDYEKAAGHFQNVIAEHADTEWEIFASDRLGRCYEAQEKWDQAAKVYRPAIKKLSSYSGAAVTQARIGEMKRRLLSSYQNLQDRQSIIDMYEEMLAENPATPSAPEDQFQLAQAFLEDGNLQKAAENFALVVERYPASPYSQQVREEQADLLSSQLDYDWELFSTFQIAQGLRRTGQYDEALAQFDQISDAAPGIPMAHAATFQKHLVEYQKSGDAFALQDQLATGREEYPYGFGGAPVDQLSGILQGICQAQVTLESNPQDAGAYQQMGLGYYQTQAYQPGIGAYQKAITLDPETPLAHNMLGYCCIGAQQYEQAISAFHQLVEVAPDDPNSYDSLAEGYWEKGDTTLAIQHYQQSLAVDSTFTNPYFMLGNIYQEMGQREKALECYQRYLRLDPDGFQSQNARVRLEQLQAQPSEENPPEG
jgi:tetratricopeptide (TPR) repeat protein